MSRKRPRPSVSSHIKYETDSSEHDFDENVMIPNPDKSGSDDSDSKYNSDSDSNSKRNMKIFNLLTEITYREALQSYFKNQDKFEKDHVFIWKNGEKIYTDIAEEKVLLTESVKKIIRENEPVKLFETFF